MILICSSLLLKPKIQILFWISLEDLVKRDTCVARAVPPATECQVLKWWCSENSPCLLNKCYLEPIFKGEPTKGVYDQLSLSEVCGLQKTSQISKFRTCIFISILPHECRADVRASYRWGRWLWWRTPSTGPPSDLSPDSGDTSLGQTSANIMCHQERN